MSLLGCIHTVVSCDHIFVHPMFLSGRILWIHLFLSLCWYWSFLHSRCLDLALLNIMTFTWDHSWSLSSTFWMTSLPSIVPWCHLQTWWGFTESLPLSLMKVLYNIGPGRKSWGTLLINDFDLDTEQWLQLFRHEHSLFIQNSTYQIQISLIQMPAV